MNQDSVIVPCSSCGAKNRIPRARLKEHPVCGKCHAAIQVEAAIIKCAACGAKNRIPKVLLGDQAQCGQCHQPLQVIPKYDYAIELNDRTFADEVLSFPGPVLTEFYSPMCAYCRTLDPILGQLAAQYAGRAKISKINIEQNPMTASQFGIMSTPTMILFKDGKKVNKLVGSLGKAEIEGHLNYIL